MNSWQFTNLLRSLKIKSFGFSVRNFKHKFEGQTTVVPSNAISGLGHKAPSDKLNIAGVGIGGMGFAADLIKHNYREGWSLPDMPA